MRRLQAVVLAGSLLAVGGGTATAAPVSDPGLRSAATASAHHRVEPAPDPPRGSIPRVAPRQPGPVRMPLVRPGKPGPVPMPEARSHDEAPLSGLRPGPAPRSEIFVTR